MRRRRAAFRAGHRGSKELDFLVGKYAQTHLADMDDAQLSEFERLLSVPDPDLQSWIMNGVRPDDPQFETLLDSLRRFHGLA